MKRIISALLIAAILLMSVLSFSAVAAKQWDEIIQVASEYQNSEVLVMYRDGTVKVESYSTDAELALGIKEFSKADDVILVQPNYDYTQAGSLTGDALAGEQWALNNDGTFYMEEGGNEYPVFDTPFGEIRLPFEWKLPDFFGIPGGILKPSYTVTTNINAVCGIDVGMEGAWNIYNNNGREVVVAVVDTGIDYEHEDLKDNIWTNSDEIPHNGIDDDGNGYADDTHGWNFYNENNIVYTGSEDDHGTHGAGTIAAEANNGHGIAGLNQGYNVRVMSVKALGGPYGSGSTASVIRAIQYAEANGATICNLSLGTSNNDRALYHTMANSNMLFVAAAGNNGENTDNDGCYPASYDLDNIISVANLNYDGTLNYSSNYGYETVDIAAPGSYVLSTITDNGYCYMTGTSMAAPFVSGAAALLYTHFDNITPADIKEIILATAKPLESLNGAVKTGGMLDITSALNFDVSNLSGTVWPVKTPVMYTGSAPVIETSILKMGPLAYLVFKVYDTDGDISYICYANGQRPAEFFGKGNQEFILKPDSEGRVLLQAKNGVYTFFAIDSAGHQTVHSITVDLGNSGTSPGYGDGTYNNPGVNVPDTIDMKDILSSLTGLFKKNFGY